MGGRGRSPTRGEAQGRPLLPWLGLGAQVEGPHGEGSPAPSEATEKVGLGCATATKGTRHCQSNTGKGGRGTPAWPFLGSILSQHLP